MPSAVDDVQCGAHALSERQAFCWGSLQINKNTVSRPHVDGNNSGPSLIILFGSFAEGAFRMSDNSLIIDEVGTALAIDGTLKHESAPFTGERYSIVAFLHNSTTNLEATVSLS